MFNTGVEIRLNMTKDEPKHFHQEFEIIYLLDGELKIKNQMGTLTMEKDDIVIINSLESHEIEEFKAGRSCHIMIDSSVFDDLLGEGEHLFDCVLTGETARNNNNYLELRQLITELLREYLQNNSRIGYMQFGIYLQLVDYTAKTFLMDSENLRGLISKSDRLDNRIRDVIVYVQDNYNKQIKLSDLAKTFYITDSHLSRVLKKALGISYREFLNKIRINHAVEDLLFTENSIIRVANDNGFSSLAVFNKVFKETHNTVPSAYRKQMKSVAEKERQQQKEVAQQTKADIEHFFQGGLKQHGSQDGKIGALKVIADVSEYVPYTKTWQEMISCGAAVDLLNPKIQEHILFLKAQLNFTYARFWGIFHEEMMIFSSGDLSRLNFNKINDALSFLINNKIKPFIQLGPKPRRIHGNVGRNIGELTKNIMIYDLDASQWGTLIDRLMKHLLLKFGAQEVESWIFEMWSPCPWDGEWYEWYSEEKFAILYRTIKKYVPGGTVGGCEFVFEEQTKKMEETLAYWRLRSAVPDFISYTAFPYGGWNETGTPWITDIDCLKKTLKRIRDEMAAYNILDCKLYISAWNLTVSNRNILNDTVFKGAYIIKNAIDTIDEVDMIGYWICSDAYAEHYDSQSILFGGAGLISKDGLRKPAMYAFLFLQKLRSYIVEKGDNYIITRNFYGSYTIVYHNLKALNYQVYLKPEGELAYSEVDSYFDDTEPMELEIKLLNVQEGLYNVRIQAVHEESGNVLDEWQKIGGFTEIHEEEHSYLDQISIPRINISRQTTEKGQLKFQIKARANEFGVIEIFPVLT